MKLSNSIVIAGFRKQRSLRKLHRATGEQNKGTKRVEVLITKQSYRGNGKAAQMKKAQRRDEDRGSHFSPKTKVCVKTVPLRRKSVRLIFSQRQGRQADDSVAVWIAELF